MRSATGNRGFTLVELLVTVAILGILAAIALPRYSQYRREAEVPRAKAELSGIRGAVFALALDTNEWPGHQAVGTINTGFGNEIWDLNTQQAGLTSTDGAYLNWKGPYLITVPKDPWGNDYFFDTDYNVGGADAVALGSFGPNGVGPNSYDADDVIVLLGGP